MSHREKWRRWCKAIEDNILQQYKHDKLIYKGYLNIIESNKSIQSPADFHNWCCQNYGNTLLVYIRKLADKDPRTYSIRKLVGDIANNNRRVTRYALLRCYEARHKQSYLNYWDTNIGNNHKFLPKGIPLQHINKIKSLTEKAVNMVESSIVHTNRKIRARTFEFAEADKIIFELVKILYFYSVLIGGQVACDINNYSIQYDDDDWQSIFNQPWAPNTSY